MAIRTVARQAPAVINSETRALLLRIQGAIRDYVKDPTLGKLYNVNRELDSVELLEHLDQKVLARKVIGGCRSNEIEIEDIGTRIRDWNS